MAHDDNRDALAVLANASAAETVCVAGGLALMVLGAGLIAAHPSVRRLLETGITQLAPTIENPLSVNLGGVIPDVERYLRIKTM